MSLSADRFERLVWPLRADVLRVALILTRRPVEAEDLSQEALLKAFRFLDQLRPDTDTRAWLFTILRRTHIDRLRSRPLERRHVVLSSLGSELAEAPPSCAPGADLGETDPAAIFEQIGDDVVIDALQCVPDDIRWALLLVDVQQLELAAAAEVLEVPVGTVKSRLHRGRAMLRPLLLSHARALRLAGEEPKASES